jgi:probable phosphoglycerate mutase
LRQRLQEVGDLVNELVAEPPELLRRKLDRSWGLPQLTHARTVPLGSVPAVDTAILARHAESELSVRALVGGLPSTPVGLTEAGRAQAERLGRLLECKEIDLCVTSEFPRTAETADVALDGRTVPRLTIAELNDPRYGSFEGGSLAAYRAWAHDAASTDVPDGDGESRAALVERYARGYRQVLARPERVVLVVGHSLPTAYVLEALEGRDPAPVVPIVEYAYPHHVLASALALAIERLEAWCRAPTW